MTDAIKWLAEQECEKAVKCEFPVEHCYPCWARRIMAQKEDERQVPNQLAEVATLRFKLARHEKVLNEIGGIYPLTPMEALICKVAHKALDTTK